MSKYEKGQPLRFIIQTGLNNRFNEHWGLALDVSTSFALPENPLFLTTVNTTLEDGTQVISPLRIKSSILAIKPNYTFEYRGFTPFIAVGLGYNNIVNRINLNNKDNIDRLSKWSFSIIPEVGLGIGNFSISLKSVIGGHLDGFDETNPEGIRLILPENRYLMFYITGNHRFSISKNNRNKFF